MFNHVQYSVNSCPRKYSIRLCHIECRLTVTETYLSDHACTQYGDRTINTTKMNELDDFIGKFKRLQQAGKEANLVLNTLKIEWKYYNRYLSTLIYNQFRIENVPAN